MDIEISVVPNDWGEDKEAEDEKQQQQTEDTETRDQSLLLIMLMTIAMQWNVIILLLYTPKCKKAANSESSVPPRDSIRI